MANRRPHFARGGGIFVGPLTADTGIGTLVEALDLFPAARIEVVGSGAEGVRLAHHPQVRLVGNLEGDELQARLEAAAYLVLPTLAYDATPRPLVNAFANGTPVIASRVGSLAELIEPGRNGLLFDAGSARDLARRLAWAEAFPEKMRQMGECARADYHARFIQSFSYRTLFGERRRTARL
jgi:glycosyltransferase involved in cell wall biosynthesis